MIGKFVKVIFFPLPHDAFADAPLHHCQERFTEEKKNAVYIYINVTLLWQ